MVLPATLDPSGPLDNTIGALFIGTLISAVLHGFCILQALLYFQKYRQDVWIIKAAVLTVVLLDTLHLLMISVGIYHYVIVYYHDQDQLRYPYWPLVVQVSLIGVNAGVIQVFYTYRVWRLSKRNWLLCVLIIILVLAEFGSGLAWVSLLMQMKTFQQLLNLTPLSLAINIFSCSADLLIAGSLCFFLHRARTGFRQSNTIINKLILFVITTGLFVFLAVLSYDAVITLTPRLTTIVAISAFISLILAPDGLIYGAFYFCLGRLYTNSFLTTLNARSARNPNVDEPELQPSNIALRGTTASKPRNISIQLETTHEAVVDKESTVSEFMPTKDNIIDRNEDARLGQHLV